MKAKPRVIALAVAALMFLAFGAGCDGTGDSTGIDITELPCVEGEAVYIEVPLSVFCSVARITATITGPGMTDVNEQIDPKHPSVTITVPSGPDRTLIVSAYTVDNPGAPAAQFGPKTFCIPEGQPVMVTVNITSVNRAPSVGSISPPGGTVTSGQPVTLSVGASEPDACDRIDEYVWSTDLGTISGSGATVQWLPQCSLPPGTTAGQCLATVQVEVRDRRGGRGDAAEQYTVLTGAGPPPPPVNQPPVITDLREIARKGTSVFLEALATDADGDPLTWEWRTTGGTLTFSGNRARLDPPFGTHTVTATVRDGNGGSDTASIVVDLTQPNRPPVINSMIVYGPNGGLAVIVVDASDPDGDPLSYQWSTTDGLINAVGNQAQIYYTGSTITITVSVEVSDGRGGMASDSVDIYY